LIMHNISSKILYRFPKEKTFGKDSEAQWERILIIIQTNKWFRPLKK